MPRPTYPRPNRQHALSANRALAKHASTVGVPITLPIPIELIIEQTYRLEILWDEIEEPPNTMILGALAPRDRRIVLNSRHEALFEEYVGPGPFTLAHELSHWIYDADDSDQIALNLGDNFEPQYCYHRESPGLSEDTKIREVNANKLAAHLLLPEDLVRRVNIEEVLGDLAGIAAKWQVSQTTLRIRLQELGLIRNMNPGQSGLL